MKQNTRIRMDRAARVRCALIANKIFDDYSYNYNFEQFLERLEKYKGVVNAQINYLNSTYPDNRSGLDTYGYNDKIRIQGNLEYISDRFNAVFRLRWMAGILENV